MITNIKIEDALANTALIKRLVEEQIRIIKDYGNSVNQFEGIWAGEGHKAFVKTFTDLNPDALKHFSNILDYNKQITNLLEQLQQIDKDSARLFQDV